MNAAATTHSTDVDSLFLSPARPDFYALVAKKRKRVSVLQVASQPTKANDVHAWAGSGQNANYLFFVGIADNISMLHQNWSEKYQFKYSPRERERETGHPAIK